MTRHLVITCVIVSVFMAAQDFFGTNMTIGEAHGVRFWPGVWDALNDYASRYGGAVTAVGAVKYGLWSWQTALIVTCVAVTSFFTTNETTQLNYQLTGKRKRLWR